MRKQEQTRDYNNYDYLFATVKKRNFFQLRAHYKTLGWEDIEQKEDEDYYDVVHISLRRPHKIAHKDELQLMQVHLEAAWNTIGKCGRKHCPKAIAFGVIFSIISLALITFGLLSAFEAVTFLPRIYGFVIAAAGGVAAIITTVLSIVICSKELKLLRLKRLTAEEEIAEVCARAKQLLNTEQAPADGEELAEVACE